MCKALNGHTTKFKERVVLDGSLSQVQNQIWPEAFTHYKAALIAAPCNTVEIQGTNCLQGGPTVSLHTVMCKSYKHPLL